MCGWGVRGGGDDRGMWGFSTGQAFLPLAISCCFAQWRVGVPRAAGHTHHSVCLLGACIYCVPVYVDDANQVVQFVVPSEGGCLPDASLCTLPITHHAVHTIAVGVHVCACVCCVCVCVCVCVWCVCGMCVCGVVWCVCVVFACGGIIYKQSAESSTWHREQLPSQSVDIAATVIEWLWNWPGIVVVLAAVGHARSHT